MGLSNIVCNTGGMVSVWCSMLCSNLHQGCGEGKIFMEVSTHHNMYLHCGTRYGIGLVLYASNLHQGYSEGKIFMEDINS